MRFPSCNHAFLIQPWKDKPLQIRAKPSWKNATYPSYFYMKTLYTSLKIENSHLRKDIHGGAGGSRSGKGLKGSTAHTTLSYALLESCFGEEAFRINMALLWRATCSLRQNGNAELSLHRIGLSQNRGDLNLYTDCECFTTWSIWNLTPPLSGAAPSQLICTTCFLDVDYSVDMHCRTIMQVSLALDLLLLCGMKPT